MLLSLSPSEAMDDLAALHSNVNINPFLHLTGPQTVLTQHLLRWS